MEVVKDIKHKDKSLNMLRWLAFGAVGLYLWRVNKVEGKEMGSDHPNNFKLSIDSDKLVDAATNLVPGTEPRKQMFNIFAKEFINGYKRKKASQ